jgi:hypothetical protein
MLLLQSDWGKWMALLLLLLLLPCCWPLEVGMPLA